jgi:hypothetical protein
MESKYVGLLSDEVLIIENHIGRKGLICVFDSVTDQNETNQIHGV